MKKLIVLLAVAFSVGCAKDLTEQVTIAPQSASSKILTSSDPAAGDMIVYFGEEAVSRVESGVSRSGATRTGIEQLDGVLETIGVKHIERVFPVDIRHEERTREAGLHRWYVVKFDESYDLGKAAAALAEIAEVERVQYNGYVRSVADAGVVRPVASGDEEQALMPTAGETRAAAKFNDPDLYLQWHYINTGNVGIYSGIKAGADVNCAEAWEVTAGDPRIIVAVVDDAVKWDHPDLADNMWVNTAEKNGVAGVDDDNNGYVDDVHGYNFAMDTPLTLSTESALGDHGTHVAGTVAAVNNNGIGGCGVAGGTGVGDGARIMSCQIFYNQYGATDVGTARAFKYAADNGAVIAQCSYGSSRKITSDRAYYSISSAEVEGVKYFESPTVRRCAAINGGVAIFAAGNQEWNYSCYPGAYREFISVTAMACDYTPGYYTCYGKGANVAAPGGDYLQSFFDDDANNRGSRRSEIYSTTYVAGQYGYMQGTSMACPHVSGVAALGLSYALELGRTLSVEEFKTILLTSVNDIDRYCTGQKYRLAGNTVSKYDISKYAGKMGTGYIDAFQVLMNVKGTPCIPVRLGVKQSIDISKFLGGGVAGLTFLDKPVEISPVDKAKLGVEGEVTISSTGKLQIKCTKPGSAVVKFNFIAGGSELGSEEGAGGMAITKEVAIIARGMASNGGWL